MTERQRITLQADWWPAACRAQGWKISDRALRLRVCAWAVSLENPTQLELLEAIRSDRQPSRWLESTNDLDNKTDVDRVKACLGMLADNLSQTKEVGQPQYGSARRKRDLIRSHLKCLALFEAHPRRYLATLINDMFNHGRPGVTIKDLTDDPKIKNDGRDAVTDLQRLLMRMAQVVNDKRKENKLVPPYDALYMPGHPLSIHEMKCHAGVPCDCKQCSERRRHGQAPKLDLPPLEENWSDFDPELESSICGDPDLGNATPDETSPF